MSDENKLTLQPRHHGKLGVVHCGVTRDGWIAVAGDPRSIEDGEEIMFEKVNIRASRKGNDYIFEKVA